MLSMQNQLCYLRINPGQLGRIKTILQKYHYHSLLWCLLIIRWPWKQETTFTRNFLEQMSVYNLASNKRSRTIADNSNHFTLIYVIKNIILNNLSYNLINSLLWFSKYLQTIIAITILNFMYVADSIFINMQPSLININI